MRTYGAVVEITRQASTKHEAMDDELYFETEAKNEQDAVRRTLTGALEAYPCSKVQMLLLSRMKEDKPVKSHYLPAFMQAAAKGLHVVDPSAIKHSNAAADKVANNWPPPRAKKVQATTTTTTYTAHRLDGMLDDDLFERIAYQKTFNSNIT